MIFRKTLCVTSFFSQLWESVTLKIILSLKHEFFLLILLIPVALSQHHQQPLGLMLC